MGHITPHRGCFFHISHWPGLFQLLMSQTLNLVLIARGAILILPLEFSSCVAKTSDVDFRGLVVRVGEICVKCVNFGNVRVGEITNQMHPAGFKLKSEVTFNRAFNIPGALKRTVQPCSTFEVTVIGNPVQLLFCKSHPWQTMAVKSNR